MLQHERRGAFYVEQLNDDLDGACVCDCAVFLHRCKREYDNAETCFLKSLPRYPGQSSTHPN